MPLPTVSSLARKTISCAFMELESTITPGDARNFRSVTLEQVKHDVLKLENELAARQTLVNMRRLAPLFQGLEHYAKVMDVLCNGTPFLSWAWAPISLILRIASEHLEACDLIIKGYSRIAECLGRFSVLDSSFKSNQDFQQTFAVFYADILEFHKHAYKFVRRRSWKLFFLTSWHRFERRFDNILENLQRHEALIDKEANAYNIVEAKQMRQDIRAWREDCLEKYEQAEKEQNFKQYQSIMSWLKVDESDQLNILHGLQEETSKYPGTCGWLLQNRKMALMLQRKPDVPLLWVQGAAGTGKSVLASSIVKFAESAGSLVLSHFCNYAYPSSTKYEWILKSLLLQLVRKDSDLASHVFESCVLGKKAPSLPILETLLRDLLSSASREPGKVSYIWIVIDGIDECEVLAQNKVFSLISQVTSKSTNTEQVLCKALVFCRFSSSASSKLRKSQSISLAEEKKHVYASIRQYADTRLKSIYNKFEQMSLTMNDIKQIEDAVTEKADGMFLYARLVLDYLSTNIFFSGEEIKMSVHELPAKLSEFKIITQILVRLDRRSVDRIKCALGWIAFSKRPLKKMEFLSAIAFSSGDKSVKHTAPTFMLDMCAPLIEERPDSRLGFIHVSVKEFLESPSSNLVLMKQECLLQHGIATVTCLLAGIEAFGNGLPSESVLVSIIKGLHGFHIYSKEYWTEYLLALLPSSMGPGYTTSPLFDLAVELATNLNELSMKVGTFSQTLQQFPDVDQEPRKFVDGRIGTLQSSLLQIVLNKCLNARSENQLEAILQGMEAKRQPIDDASTSPIPCPREGVSLILQEYQATIRFILNQPDYAGVTAAELESFKRYFRDCAYTCRVKGCIRATEGFDRLAQCHEHEILHVRRLICPHQGCRYPPFVSSRALRAHVNKDHNPTPKSKSIRKMSETQPNLHGTAEGLPAGFDYKRMTAFDIPGPTPPAPDPPLGIQMRREIQEQAHPRLRDEAEFMEALADANRYSAARQSRLQYPNSPATQSAPPPDHMEHPPILRPSSRPYPAAQAPRMSKAQLVSPDHTETPRGPHNYTYIENGIDEAGETKIDPNGNLIGTRKYRCLTFMLRSRGFVLLMLAIQCTAVLGYKHPDALFDGNPSLPKIIATQSEKNVLISMGIIPYGLLPYDIFLVTARSMFRQFGSKMIKDGVEGDDDYWVSKQSDSHNTMATSAGPFYTPTVPAELTASLWDATAIELAKNFHLEDPLF